MKKVISNHSEIRYHGCFGILLMLLCLCTSAIHAQEVTDFEILVKFNVADGDFKNSTIIITKDGAPFRVINPNKEKHNVTMPFGGEYLFTFKKLGYITKAVIVNTKIPAGREKEPFARFSMEVRILPQPEDQIVTYTQPVGIIKYSTEISDFDFDKDYSLTVSDMQKKAVENAVKVPKPPTPNPRPTPPVIPEQTIAPSKPVPIAVKQPEYKPEPPKKKPVVQAPAVPAKPIIKNKTVKVIQEDKRKITIVSVNVNGTDFIYKKEEYSWGGIYYYKSDKRITELTFEREADY
jgi:hypothetical protein